MGGRFRACHAGSRPAYRTCRAFLLFGVLCYLGWHLFNVVRLLRGFQEGKRFHPPEVGVWGDVYYNIYRLQQRNRLRRRRIVRMLNRFQEATAVMPDATVVMGCRGKSSGGMMRRAICWDCACRRTGAAHRQSCAASRFRGIFRGARLLADRAVSRAGE